jgi:hypothetical protein
MNEPNTLKAALQDEEIQFSRNALMYGEALKYLTLIKRTAT